MMKKSLINRHQESSPDHKIAVEIAERLYRLKALWDRFPGRSCSEVEWNIWVTSMNKEFGKE